MPAITSCCSFTSSLPSLELHGPIFHYQATHYIEQVKLIEINGNSRVLVCLQAGPRVEYSWVELPSVKASSSYPLRVQLKMNCLIELDNSKFINFIYIPYENRLAIFGDDDIFVTDSMAKEQLSLRKNPIPMQTEFGALVNYIPVGKECTTQISISYESRYKAAKGTANLGKALLMTRLGKYH